MSRRDGSVYLPLSLTDVQGSPVAKSTLFLKSRDSYVVFREAGSRVDRQAITQLKSSDIDTLYVLCTDGESIDHYVSRHLTQALHDPNVEPSEKAHLLTASSMVKVSSKLT